MSKAVNTAKGISDHVSLVPEYSWVRRNRGVLSAVLLSALCGTVAVEWARHGNGDGLESPKIEVPTAPLAEKFQTPLQAKELIPVNQVVQKPQPRVALPIQTPKPERPKAAWENFEGEKRESAQIILNLSADNLERAIRDAGFYDVPVLVQMTPALRDLQSALRGTDYRLAKEKAAEFLRLASLLQTDEALEKYWEKMDTDSFSEEFKTVLTPAYKGAEILVTNDFGG